jgi:glycine/D-amino acid oxidase-like deaminating enzyme
VSERPRRVVVVGAGVAGLFTAYYLRRHDVDVTVVDATGVGSRDASSWGNGGWITPAQAGPLPEPGLTVYGLRALLNVDSALYFRPGYLPRLIPWLVRFWTYCNTRDFERGTAALAALGKRSFELVPALGAQRHAFGLLVGPRRQAIDHGAVHGHAGHCRRPKSIADNIQGDLVQPRSQSELTAALRRVVLERAVRPHEGVLRRFFGVWSTAGEPQREAVQAILVGANEWFEVPVQIGRQASGQAAVVAHRQLKQRLLGGGCSAPGPPSAAGRGFIQG